MKVLLTGGAGYIGSTVASACLDAGHVPVIVDDLSAGARAFTAGREFFHGDFADPVVLDAVFATHADVAAVVHCAASVGVSASVNDPIGFYDNNVARGVRLLELLGGHGCDRFLFSSSGSVYPAGDGGAIGEDRAAAPSNPYGRTKAVFEQVLADVAAAGRIRAMSLRYFNPIGADPQLRTGQPRAEHSLVLDQLDRAYRQGTAFTITGTGWPTRDGTAIRDYVHVWDVARAHVQALERFDAVLPPAAGGLQTINLGTGRGTTVRELVATFEQVVGARVRTVDGPPREGDPAGGFAAVDKARQMLGWCAELSIADGIRDALAWAGRRDAVLAGSA